MQRTFIFIGATAGSWLGWYLGDLLIGGPFVALFVSTLLGAVGIYLGWKWGGE